MPALPTTTSAALLQGNTYLQEGGRNVDPNAPPTQWNSNVNDLVTSNDGAGAPWVLPSVLVAGGSYVNNPAGGVSDISDGQNIPLPTSAPSNAQIASATST